MNENEPPRGAREPQSPQEEDFDAEELESAAEEDLTPRIAPEEDSSTETLTEWDEPPDIAGTAAPKVVPEDETSVAEQLIEEGLEEADREQRIASADPDFEG